MKTSRGFLKHLIAFAFLCAGPAWAGEDVKGSCEDPLSLEAVKAHFSDLVETATAAPAILSGMGIDNPDLLPVIARISYLIGEPTEVVGQKILNIVAIESPPGIPDGNEMDADAVITMALLSSLTAENVHETFRRALEFMPLLKDKIADSSAATGLLKLSTLYRLTPAQTVAKLDEFIAGSENLKAKIKRHDQEELAKADALTRAMVSVVIGDGGQIPAELTVAAIESALASQKPIAVALRALEDLVEHAMAVRYTTHEQAAMLKAAVILGQSFDDSVAKLKILDEGAKARFGSGLAEDFERPAVNLILLGGQDPAAVLNLLEHVAKMGAAYDAAAAAVVMTKVLVDASKGHPNATLLQSSLIAP